MQPAGGGGGAPGSVHGSQETDVRTDVDPQVKWVKTVLDSQCHNATRCCGHGGVDNCGGGPFINMYEEGKKKKK